jgi:hypothetical protein
MWLQPETNQLPHFCVHSTFFHNTVEYTVSTIQRNEMLHDLHD